MNPVFDRPERITPVLFLLLLLTPIAPVSAGVFEGNGEIGFDLGWVDRDDRDHRTSQGRFTIRGGYHVNDYFQLEAQLIGSEFDGPPSGDSLAGIFANAVFNWHPGETVVPYALVGVGAVVLESSLHYGHYDHHHRHSSDDDYEDASALQLGLGSRFFFGQGRTAVRLEASLLAFEDHFDRRHELLSLSVGLTWRLGKRRPPKVTVIGGND